MASKFTIEAIFKGIDKISAPTSKMNKSVKKFALNARKAFKKVGAAVGKVAKKMAQFAGVALLAAGVALAKFTKDFIVTGDEIAKTSRQIGISAEALQELRFAADRQGISSESFTKSMQKMNKAVGEARVNTGALTTFLNKSNPALLTQLKNVESSEEAFNLLITEIDRLPNQMDKAALANAAFGRSGKEMLILAENGVEGIDALREEFKKYGAVVSTDAAKASEKIIDTFANLKASMAGVSNEVGNTFLPIVQKGLDFVLRITQGFQKWMKANRGLIDKGLAKLGKIIKFLVGIFLRLFKAAKKIFDALVRLGKKAIQPLIDNLGGGKGLAGILDTITSVIDTFATGIAFVIDLLSPFAPLILGLVAAFVLFNLVLSLNPIVVIIMAAIFAIGLLIKNWDAVVEGFKKGFGAVGQFFENIFGPIRDFLIGLWENIVKPMIDGIVFIGKQLGIIDRETAGADERLGGNEGRGSRGRGVDNDAGDVASNADRNSILNITNTNNANATLTIKDDSNKAEVTEDFKGDNFKLNLKTSGGF